MTFHSQLNELCVTVENKCVHTYLHMFIYLLGHVCTKSQFNWNM